MCQKCADSAGKNKSKSGVLVIVCERTRLGRLRDLPGSGFRQLTCQRGEVNVDDCKMWGYGISDLVWRCWL